MFLYNKKFINSNKFLLDFLNKIKRIPFIMTTFPFKLNFIFKNFAKKYAIEWKITKKIGCRGGNLMDGKKLFS